MSRIASLHSDRVVYDEGERFVKVFDSSRAHGHELANLRKLESIGVRIPRILDTTENRIVTERLTGEPLDEVVRRDWRALGRAERNRILAEVARLCRRIRDAGLDWPDLVTYHIYIAKGEEPAVLDPARLRRGRLELSPLYWSSEEPTVSRTDRLRFWRAYAGSAAPPRLRRIGHRGRFRPYRWVHQWTEPRFCPRWKRGGFVEGVETPFASADEIAEHPRLEILRRLQDRTNAVLEDGGAYVVKITADPEEARAEWEHHRVLLAAGFRVPQPVAGGVLRDGRGLFATRRLEDLFPADDVWSTLDRRRAVRAAADLARRLHACGFVHRDLYLCHLFVARGGSDLTLIDLARLKRTRSRRLRVKDLAALVHSSRGLVTRTDLLRGLRRYGGDRRLARAVLSKAERMARHVPRNVRDGTHVPHVPHVPQVPCG